MALRDSYIDQYTGLNNVDQILEDSRQGTLKHEEEEDN